MELEARPGTSETVIAGIAQHIREKASEARDEILMNANTQEV
jgi:hypothetical protein